MRLAHPQRPAADGFAADRLDPGHARGLCRVSGQPTWHNVVQSLVEAGAQTVQDLKDVGGGKLVATAKDADGNLIGLIQLPVK